MSEHDRLRESLGAFALGQLSVEEQTEVQAHLTDCAGCRAEAADLISVAGSLAHVDPDDPLPTPPMYLDQRIRSVLTDLQAAQSRRRRIPVALASALVGAAAATVGVLAVQDDEQPAPVVPEAVRITREATGIDVSAGVVDHTWGLEIDLVGTGFVQDASYHVVVTDSAGRAYDSGAFVGVGETTLTCSMSSAVLRDDAASFAVLDTAGDVVVRADLS